MKLNVSTQSKGKETQDNEIHEGDIIFQDTCESSHKNNNLKAIHNVLVLINALSVLVKHHIKSSNETCLAYELKKNGLEVKTQVALPLIYKEVKLNAGYRIDLLVENKIIIEIKSVDALADIHTAQLLPYLKLKDLKLGLLINFNTGKVIDGVKRILNGYL